jgi:formate dehydrogenase iron-sulfur subunit
MSYAILFDSTRCVGCRQCEAACAARWNLPYDETVGSQERLSAKKLTTIQTFGERYSRKLCMHCAEPSCASACPVGAFRKTAEGPVVYEASRCIGCRYCMLACAFQVPTYEWSERLPKVAKCDMCYELQRAGKPTACAEACPTQATISGNRDTLIADARKRIAENPGSYVDRIYGLQEVGGTSVLYLSAVPFDQIGMRTGLTQQPLPGLTWNALSLVPGIVSVGSVLLGGVWWITHRREEVARAEGRS